MNLSSGSLACPPNGFTELFDRYFDQSRVVTSNSVAWVSFHQIKSALQYAGAVWASKSLPLGLDIGEEKPPHFSEVFLHPNCGDR